MTEVTFNFSDNLICGFLISGHSGYGEEGYDIVCSAISSAAYMTANTITEIQHLNDVQVTESDGFISMNLSKDDAEKAQTILHGLKLHLTALSEQYPNYIKVNNSEV